MDYFSSVEEKTKVVHMQHRTKWRQYYFTQTTDIIYAYIHPEQFYMTSNVTHYISSLKHQKTIYFYNIS